MYLHSQHKVVQEDLYRGTPGEGLRDVVFETATQAMAHLKTARSMASTLPKAAFPGLLPAVSKSHSHTFELL